jgi:hypothetical protein
MKKISDNFLTNLNIKENIYLLGFIWADGWISKNKISMSLTEKDFNQIEPILKKFKINNFYKRQRFDSNGDLFGNPCKQFSIYNKNIVNFLLENDYKLKSYVSPIKILKIIPEKLHYLFWRGYFDGDGCLYIGKKIELAFWSTIEQDWSEIIKLYKTLEINKYSIYKYKRKNGKHCSSVIRIGISKDIKKICDYIYQNDLEIGLKRKYKKYKELLNIYNKIQLNKSKTSKKIGIFFNKLNGKWGAYITKNKKNKLKKNLHIGWYQTEIEAIRARKNKIKNLI